MRICQGYAPVGPGVLRVRLAGEGAFLALKSSRAGLVRSEFEYPIPVGDAESLLAEFCGAGLVEKTRHRVIWAGDEWEVDVFAGANEGLVTAEIELTAPDQPFERPPWLGAEVSDQPAYYNSNLARRPFREWNRTRPSPA
jgi:adenylate cyclase